MAKKLIYIANARMPTEKAHGLQIMKMCETFSICGYSVILLVPFRFNKIKGSPFDFYNIRRNFEIKKIFSLDLLPLEKFFGNFSFYIQNISFAKCVAFHALFRKSDIIFCRDLFSALILSFLGKKVCYEVHDSVPVNFWTKRFLKNIFQSVSTNNYKKDELIKNFKINPEKIIVAPNGVDLELFDIEESKEECRNKLNLPLNKKVVVYSGSFCDWKGTDIPKEAKLGPDIQMIWLGATKGTTTQTFQIDGKNLQYLGFRPHREIPYWLKAADVLVLPNSRKASEMQAYATSPIKLFEYMASGTPIVASDIPAIREIVSEKEVYFVEPDNPQALAEGIKKVLSIDVCAKCLSKNAKELAKQYTWQKRALKILKFISPNSTKNTMLKKFKKNLAKNPLMVNTYRGIKNTAIIPLKFTSYNIFSLEKFPLKDLLNPKKTSLFKTVWPYTKNGYSRLENVYDLAHEIENKNIKGAFIECGTYKGGCCAVMGAVANFYGCSGRKTWYLDSFEGMPDPSEFDGEDTDEIAGDVLKASVKDVEELIFEKLNLPRDKNIIIRGWFEETLPKFKYQIGDIALLRLDADWYEPTRLILEELYNQVVPGGYLIFDDYGRWQGCRKAVDDFIQKNNIQADMEFLGSAIKGKDGTRTPMYFRKK